MAAEQTKQLPLFVVCIGGDAFLNDREVRDCRDRALRDNPTAEVMELDANETDQYDFDEAVSPSLLSLDSVVVIRHVQNADESLAEAMVGYCRSMADGTETATSVIIAQHDGGQKGRKLIDRLVRAGAEKKAIPELKQADAKLNFVIKCFEREQRRVDPSAARQLVALLGERTGELAAMCSQLCFDFDDEIIGLDHVEQYLTGNAEVTGFAVADEVLAGNSVKAIIDMRAAIIQGIDPIALVGALAMKLRTLAKASAVRSGSISKAEAKTNPWVLKNAMNQLNGWTSDGLSSCIQMLAWVDEQNKTGGDSMYALERCIELIGHKGRRRA
ncbi:DNA polymerase-3 subunit delta [Bifidobacterium commune]|uniref:DNA-directed DNA polymerase n=1 Tax=Bifidobacterium commune TaxID=1505727 RepID=A0A1C4H1G7_9BIFI|nr:DNA polymerase III subunit delta [Bifidobacterium commune]MBB2954771.1 DNA polymerase-3 subunit delta [Bifidobacterium commune]SCC78745.1 DNA polymerase III, delta subunit [Bifidobacterium commune]